MSVSQPHKTPARQQAGQHTSQPRLTALPAPVAALSRPGRSAWPAGRASAGTAAPAAAAGSLQRQPVEQQQTATATSAQAGMRGGRWVGAPAPDQAPLLLSGTQALGVAAWNRTLQTIMQSCRQAGRLCRGTPALPAKPPPALPVVLPPPAPAIPAACGAPQASHLSQPVLPLPARRCCCVVAQQTPADAQARVLAGGWQRAVAGSGGGTQPSGGSPGVHSTVLSVTTTS